MWKRGDKFIRNRTSQGVPPCALFSHHMEGYTGIVRSVHRSSITDTRGRKHGMIAIDPYNEEPDMYERTKYFAMRVNPASTDEMLIVEDGSETRLRDTASMVKRDVESVVTNAEGDRWVILQTHSLLEVLPPRPPLRVTEYK